MDENEYEALCKRCGACCGISGNDLCLDLKKGEDGKYYCGVYDHRFGEHLTASGNKFTCVPIRDVLQYAPVSPDCGYK